MSLSPGSILPRDMNERQWAEWARRQSASIQPDIRTVVPEWSGFSVDPTGALAYIDLGALIVMYPETAMTFTGTSDSTAMVMFHGIDGLHAPVQAPVFLRDDAGECVGRAYITTLSPSSIQFAFYDGALFDPGGFTASGTKGWSGYIMFPKVPRRIGGGSNY